MDDFETLLDKAQLGDREAMDKLLETYANDRWYSF